MARVPHCVHCGERRVQHERSGGQWWCRRKYADDGKDTPTVYTPVNPESSTAYGPPIPPGTPKVEEVGASASTPPPRPVEAPGSHVHSCVEISEPPYRYRCTQCGARLKILSGVLVDKLQAASGTMEERKLYPWARPWNLALEAKGGAVLELTSYPYDEEGSSRIMARRTIGDPTTNEPWALGDLKPMPWTSERIEGYRDGFASGWQGALEALRRFHEEGGAR